MSILDQVKSYAEGLMAAGENVVVSDNEDGSLCIYDDREGYSLYYREENPDKIDAAWVRERMLVTPSAEELPCKVDYDAAADWAAGSIAPEMMLTLDNIVFCNDAEEDYNFLSEISEQFENNLFIHNLPSDGQLGLHWEDTGTVLVSVGNIQEKMEEMLEEGELYPHETDDCFSFGIATTLAHEIRHLAQDNPFLPEEVLGIEADIEADAENYATDLWEEHPAKLGEFGEEKEEEREEPEL